MSPEAEETRKALIALGCTYPAQATVRADGRKTKKPYKERGAQREKVKIYVPALKLMLNGGRFCDVQHMGIDPCGFRLFVKKHFGGKEYLNNESFVEWLKKYGNEDLA